jgi:hypothetical protein
MNTICSPLQTRKTPQAVQKLVKEMQGQVEGMHGQLLERCAMPEIISAEI